MSDAGMFAQGIGRALLDAIPAAVFIVEEDVRIVDFNAAAGVLLSRDKGSIVSLRGGEALSCLHASLTPEGCGHSELCKTCVIRNSVNESLHGSRVIRKKMKVTLRQGDASSNLHLLITTAPLEYEGRTFVLLTLEDISEIIALRGMLPICAKCKKIRDEKQYWVVLEKYLSEHLDVDFTHGLCSDCVKEMFPEHEPKQ